MTDLDNQLPSSQLTSMGDVEAIRHLEQAIIGGKHWYIALLEAIGRWNTAEETHNGRTYRYLIDGEAFDWLLLAERLCETVDGLLPDDETHTFYVVCQNRAEDFSGVSSVNIVVNSSEENDFDFAPEHPPDYLGISSTEIILNSNKAATCRYELNGGAKTDFTQTGDVTHRVSLSGLTEGEHTIEAFCEFSTPPPKVEKSKTFIVDMSPPSVPTVDDGNETSLSKLEFTINGSKN